jgi:hypothetical protein
MRTSLLLVSLVAAGAGVASGEGLTIAHDPVACAVAGRLPELHARFEPAANVGEARVLFRPKGGTHWYAVRMTPAAGGFRALLPRPKRDLAGFDYYLEAAGRELATVRTEEYSTVVTTDAAACQGGRVAASTAAGTVALQVPVGAPSLPVGFSGTGVVATAAGAATAGAATAGAAAAGAAGAASAGGGVSTTLLVVAGVAVAGGAAAAVALGSESGETIITGYVYLGECTCAANRPPPYAWLTAGPLAGAVISTALDGATANTDGNGRFELRTPTPSGAPSSFEGRATAPGCSSSTWTASSGDNRGDIHLTLTCANGPPPARSCNCSS